MSKDWEFCEIINRDGHILKVLEKNGNKYRVRTLENDEDSYFYSNKKNVSKLYR